MVTPVEHRDRAPPVRLHSMTRVVLFPRLAWGDGARLPVWTRINTTERSGKETPSCSSWRHPNSSHSPDSEGDSKHDRIDGIFQKVAFP